MPAYSYKERFIPMVLDASKHQTIRMRRKYSAKPGDTLYHYFGLRTKHCRKLGESICKKVFTILIKKDGSVIKYDTRLTDAEAKKALRGNLMGLVLNDKYKNYLAYDDGFRFEPTGSHLTNFDFMLRWWKQTHQLPFIGDLIYWDPETFIKHKK